MTRSFQVLKRDRRVLLGNSCNTQSPICVNVLCRDQPFAAFPWTEASGAQELQCWLPLPALVQKRDVFHCQIVPAVHKTFMLFKRAQPLLGLSQSSPFLQLIPLVQHTRIFRTGVKSARIHAAGSYRVMQYVEFRDAQIPEWNRKPFVELDRLSPTANCIFVTPLVVVEIADVVVRSRARRIPSDRVTQHDHLFEPGGETVSRRCSLCLGREMVGFLLASKRCSKPRERIPKHRMLPSHFPSASLHQGMSIVAKAGPCHLKDNVQKRVDVVLHRCNKWA